MRVHTQCCHYMWVSGDGWHQWFPSWTNASNARRNVQNSHNTRAKGWNFRHNLGVWRIGCACSATQQTSHGSGLPTKKSWLGLASWTLSGAQVRGWMTHLSPLSIRASNDKRLCPVTVNSCHEAEVVNWDYCKTASLLSEELGWTGHKKAAWANRVILNGWWPRVWCTAKGLGRPSKIW